MTTKRITEPEDLALLNKLYPIVRRASNANVALEALNMAFIGLMVDMHPADRRSAAKQLKRNVRRMLKAADNVARAEMEGGAQ